MLERDILVRILSSAETSGEITVLLSDKTGTITENNQRVNHAWIAGSDLGPLDLELGKTWRDEVARSPNLDSTVLTLFSVLVVLNSTVTYGCDGGILRGSKSEIALIDFANSINENENFSRSISEWFPVLALFPFTAERKRMCSLFMLRDSVDNSEVGDTVVRATVKGAAIDVLELCTDVMLEHGSRMPLDDETRRALYQKFDSWQEDAERVLLVAYRDIERDVISSMDGRDICERLSASDAERNLTLIGAVGLLDPLRSDALDSIVRLKRAGVDVKMVSGDSLSTCVAVAKRCGILQDADGVDAAMTSEDFMTRVSDVNGDIVQSRLDSVSSKLRVLARASPQVKFKLVDGILQSPKRRDVCAVIGDGTNDAPALRRSDVGFALGSGTETAREASDIVLLQDDLSSVLLSIQFGRHVFESVEKFITFQLTANISCICVSTGGALVFAQAPLSAIQLLFVNLIIDSLASLALATDEPSDDVLRQKPASSDKLITEAMVWQISSQCAYQCAVMAFLLQQFGPTDTQIFNTFVLLQLANQVNCRRVTTEVNVFNGITANKRFCVLLSSELLLQILIVQRGGAVFHTSPLDANEWLRCIGFALGSFPLRVFVVTLLTSFVAAWREERREHHCVRKH
jgi:Ca2+ transporting ATPase